jgi:hypothetical protein
VVSAVLLADSFAQSQERELALQGCVIVALQGCVIVALQGCVIVVLQGCVIVLLPARLRDCAMLILKISAT